MGFRLFSGLVLAVVVFIAAHMAGMEGGGAFAVALVPLISAAINVLTTPIFSVSALAGIFFIILPLLPISHWFGDDVAATLRGLTRELKSSVTAANPAQPNTPVSLSRRMSDIEAACASGVLAPAACDEAKRNLLQSVAEQLGVRDGATPARNAN